MKTFKFLLLSLVVVGSSAHAYSASWKSFGEQGLFTDANQVERMDFCGSVRDINFVKQDGEITSNSIVLSNKLQERSIHLSNDSLAVRVLSGAWELMGVDPLEYLVRAQIEIVRPHFGRVATVAFCVRNLWVGPSRTENGIVFEAGLMDGESEVTDFQVFQVLN